MLKFNKNKDIDSGVLSEINVGYSTNKDVAIDDFEYIPIYIVHIQKSLTLNRYQKISDSVLEQLFPEIKDI